MATEAVVTRSKARSDAIDAQRWKSKADEAKQKAFKLRNSKRNRDRSVVLVVVNEAAGSGRRGRIAFSWVTRRAIVESLPFR